MLDFVTTVDGSYVNTHRGDGLIVATPTGSTAYALSCGGPIIQPNVDALVMVPICPHTLSDRPLVLKLTSSIEVRVDTGAGSAAHVVCDGEAARPHRERRGAADRARERDGHAAPSARLQLLRASALEAQLGPSESRRSVRPPRLNDAEPDQGQELRRHRRGRARARARLQRDDRRDRRRQIDPRRRSRPRARRSRRREHGALRRRASRDQRAIRLPGRARGDRLASRARARRRRAMHAAARDRRRRPVALVHQRPARDAARPQAARRAARRHPRPARAPVAARPGRTARAARRARRRSKSARAAWRTRTPRGGAASASSPAGERPAPTGSRSSSCCAFKSASSSRSRPRAASPTRCAWSATGSRTSIGCCSGVAAALDGLLESETGAADAAVVQARQELERLGGARRRACARCGRAASRRRDRASRGRLDAESLSRAPRSGSRAARVARGEAREIPRARAPALGRRARARRSARDAQAAARRSGRRRRVDARS